MNQGTITCPSCGHQFELSNALTGQIREHLRSELQQDIVAREKDLKKKLDSLKEQKETLEKDRESLDEEVDKKLKLKLSETEAKVAKRAEEKYGEQLKELQESLKGRDESLKAYRETERELRRQKEALETEKAEFDLKLKRQLDEERASIRKETEGRLAEEHRLADLQKDTKIQQLTVLLEEANRKAKQGSMETQGEVLEQDFEAQLKRFFPQDDIAPVPKGIRGADLIHTVRNQLGCDAGVLLWETKNTKAWGGDWISKLKDDMMATRASMAILVSVALPDGINRFGLVNGVWVSDPLSAIPLAAALRLQLIALDRERQASTGKNEKMEMLYHYLAGSEFKQRIEGIVDAFTEMQKQLTRERKAMEAIWADREKQLVRVVKNTAGLYGDMQGIIGGHIPRIPTLELEAGNGGLLGLTAPSSADASLRDRSTLKN